MHPDVQLWIVYSGVFSAVAVLTALIGFYLEKRRRLQYRLRGADSVSPDAIGGLGPRLASQVIGHFDPKLLGLEDPASRSKLQSSLIGAGYFSPDAPRIFLLARALLMAAAPITGYTLMRLYWFPNSSSLLFFELSMLIYAGYRAPDLYIGYRKAKLATTYRVVFPDFLDLLIVCIDAGHSLNSALDKVTREFATQCKPLTTNLAILLSEVRSGRAITDALDNLSGRLGIAEARSFATLIKQSVELGSDVGEAMRVYADEMREKRMLRAEEKANALPVKLLLPLGLCIFPVILIVILAPSIIRAVAVFSHLLS
jgi:tight adherence protein C